jgi:hypothetical protein
MVGPRGAVAYRPSRFAGRVYIERDASTYKHQHRRRDGLPVFLVAAAVEQYPALVGGPSPPCRVYVYGQPHHPAGHIVDSWKVRIMHANRLAVGASRGQHDPPPRRRVAVVELPNNFIGRNCYGVIHCFSLPFPLFAYSPRAGACRFPRSGPSIDGPALSPAARFHGRGVARGRRLAGRQAAAILRRNEFQFAHVKVVDV